MVQGEQRAQESPVVPAVQQKQSQQHPWSLLWLGNEMRALLLWHEEVERGWGEEGEGGKGTGGKQEHMEGS